jgi:signal transduction histidine kinase
MRLIFVVLIATMLGFGGSIVYSQKVASALDDNAISIAMNASPSIQYLATARGEILRIELAAVSAILSSSEEGRLDRTPFDDALSLIRRELNAYLELPFDDGEREHYREADEALQFLDIQVSDLLAHLSVDDLAGAIDALRTGVSPAALRADKAIERLTEFNAEQQHRLGMQIPKLRTRAARIGYFLEAVTAILGLVLMGLVSRAISRYTRLLAGQKRLTEENARKVAAFQSRIESLIGSSVSIAETITSARDLQHVFQIICDEARTALNAQYCGLGCGTDPDRSFDPWVFSGTPAAAVEALGRPPRPVGLLGEVIAEGRPIRLAELASHSVFRGLPPHHPPMGPFLGVPIVRAGRNVANLYLARKQGEPAFSEEDERAAEMLAAYVGVAIGNARLYNQALAATRAREDLLTTVSHDLKNPLSTIRISTEMLRRAPGEGGASNIAARIDRSAERMSRLIADLLDASKIEAGVLRTAPQPEDAASLINSAAEMFRVIAMEKSIRLVPVVPTRALFVLCERELILRVFANLISNAIKFSPSGGSVSVVAEELAGQIQFSVTDAGPGISAEHLAHAFERYWQQKLDDRRGSGLGLYIAKGIVEAHGGRIWIKSGPGQGTAVHFTVPLAQRRDDFASPSL